MIQDQDEREVKKLVMFKQKIIDLNKKKIEQICNFVIQDSENIIKKYIEQQRKE